VKNCATQNPEYRTSNDVPVHHINSHWRLKHDFFVREPAGRYALDDQGVARFDQEFQVEKTCKPEDRHVAAFVHVERSGEIL
jgi:hypothetical protein